MIRRKRRRWKEGLERIKGRYYISILLFCERGNGHKHVFFAHHEIGGVERCQLEAVAVGNGIRWAGFDAVSAKDAAVVIDVVDLGESLGRGDAILRVFSAASM